MFDIEYIVAQFVWSRVKERYRLIPLAGAIGHNLSGEGENKKFVGRL
jgi:hypothetical protein